MCHAGTLRLISVGLGFWKPARRLNDISGFCLNGEKKKRKALWMSKRWGEEKEEYEIMSLKYYPATVVHDG